MRTIKNSKKERHISYQIVAKNDLSGQASPSNPVVRVAPVGQDTIGTSEMARDISETCTLTPADVKAVLEALGDYMRKTLLSGNRLRVDNVGTFGVSLACSYTNSEGERCEHKQSDNISGANDVYVKNIVFAPDASLKKAMKEAVFVNSGLTPFQAPSDAEVEERLTEWFGSHSSILTGEVEALFGCSCRFARNLLNSLVDEGRLSAEGSRNTRYYRPVGDNFQR
ncbi:MAG: HU family DNA-binding protein [Bacteroidaceae bacterium]|nr:HU family DNA-binding protein [Bacteroidaceae bacterium]